MLGQVKAFYSWAIRNKEATELLEPRIRDVPGTNRFVLDTSTIGLFKQRFIDSGLFAPEFGGAVDRYYDRYRKRFEALTQDDFDREARNVRGPLMEVENMDIFFCAQEYEYKPEFVDAMKISRRKIEGDNATAVVESPYEWKTTFNFKRIDDQWLITGYCVYK